MISNHLEELIAEWYEYKGFFVRRNIKVGKRQQGGYECELDIVAFHPELKKIVHIESSLDADSWARREERFQKKFEAGRRYIPQILKGLDLPNEIEQIAVLFFASKAHRKTLAGGKIMLVSDLLIEIVKGFFKSDGLLIAPIMELKHDIIRYCKDLRKEERAAKSFGLISIARAIAHVSSRGLEFEQTRELLPIAMTLAVALSVPVELAIDVIALAAHLFKIPYERSSLMAIEDKLTVSAQHGLPLERAYRELLSFRNTAYRDHNRFDINEVLAAMTALSRDGIEEVGAALGEIYNTLDKLGDRYPSLKEAILALRDSLLPFLAQH